MKKNYGFKGLQVSSNVDPTELIGDGTFIMNNTSFRYNDDIEKVELVKDGVNSNQGVIIHAKSRNCKNLHIMSFNEIGYGWFMENNKMAESIQVYKSDNYDNYYVLLDIIDKIKGVCKRNDGILFGKDKLYSHLENYFYNSQGNLCSISEFLSEGMDDDFFNNIYDRFELDKN